MTKSKFEDLSSEIVLCIFDYLSVADRYNGFFRLNSRYKHLVKKWTDFSRKDLYFDVKRFSTLHSWYKHLGFIDDGKEYFLCPVKGQQARYSFDPRVTDPNGLHWIFSIRPNETAFLKKNEPLLKIILRHSVRLNPFFHGSIPAMFNDKASKYRSYYGGHIILMRHKNQLKSWLQMNYPDTANKMSADDWRETFELENILNPIFENEGRKARDAIFKAAEQIWNEITQLDDFNPLEFDCNKD